MPVADRILESEIFYVPGCVCTGEPRRVVSLEARPEGNGYALYGIVYFQGPEGWFTFPTVDYVRQRLAKNIEIIGLLSPNSTAEMRRARSQVAGQKNWIVPEQEARELIEEFNGIHRARALEGECLGPVEKGTLIPFDKTPAKRLADWLGGMRSSSAVLRAAA